VEQHDQRAIAVLDCAPRLFTGGDNRVGCAERLGLVLLDRPVDYLWEKLFGISKRQTSRHSSAPPWRLEDGVLFRRAPLQGLRGVAPSVAPAPPNIRRAPLEPASGALREAQRGAGRALSELQRDAGGPTTRTGTYQAASTLPHTARGSDLRHEPESGVAPTSRQCDAQPQITARRRHRTGANELQRSSPESANGAGDFLPRRSAGSSVKDGPTLRRRPQAPAARCARVPAARRSAPSRRARSGQDDLDVLVVVDTDALKAINLLDFVHEPASCLAAFE